MKGLIAYIVIFALFSFAANADSTTQLVFKNEEQRLSLYYILDDMQRGSHRVSLLLPDGERYIFDNIFHYTLRDGRTVLSGSSRDGGGSIQLYFSEPGEFLRGIFSASLAEYELSGSGHVLESEHPNYSFSKVNLEVVPAHESHDVQVEKKVYGPQTFDSEKSLSADTFSGLSEDEPNSLSINSTVADHTISMLVAYTPAASAQLNIHERIEDLIMQTNMVFDNSNLDYAVRVELAHTFMLPIYTPSSYEPISSQYQLALMSNRSDLSQIRAIHGADVVAVLFADSELSVCGRANMKAKSRGAYFIMRASCYRTYTFAHELGHIFGAAHNPTDAGAGNPFYWPEFSSPYSYGHGFRSSNSNPPFRTVMAYPCSDSCPRIPMFSSPLLSYQGIRAGDTSRRDNRRVINRRAATIASFGGDPYPGEMPPDLSILPFYCKGQHQLSWTEVPEALSYVVSGVDNPESSSSFVRYAGPNTSVVLNLQQTEYLWVSACNEQGCTRLSNRVEAFYYEQCL